MYYVFSPGTPPPPCFPHRTRCFLLDPRVLCICSARYLTAAYAMPDSIPLQFTSMTLRCLLPRGNAVASASKLDTRLRRPSTNREYVVSSVDFRLVRPPIRVCISSFRQVQLMRCRVSKCPPLSSIVRHPPRAAGRWQPRHQHVDHPPLRQNPRPRMCATA